MGTLRLFFDRGTLRVDGACDDPRVRFDARTGFYRAPAYLYRALLDEASAVEDTIACRQEDPGVIAAPELRGYQQAALTAFEIAGRHGIVVLPTGSGKTRVACAAIARARTSTLILVPTRALLEQWTAVLTPLVRDAIGIVGDGMSRLAPITVMTFESAFRRLDAWGDRFGMLVVDEVHHFGTGMRAEALEMCVAPIRLGLTATPPIAGSMADERLRDLIGPVVYELGIGDLAGSHLAALEVIRIGVELTREERLRYDLDIERFTELRREIRRRDPRADFQVVSRLIARMPDGPAILAAMMRASALAAFPAGKRRLVDELLARHRQDRVLIFTASASDAYAVGAAALVPTITAETSRGERLRILDAFRIGELRTICSARVLNEGIDVPDANVAIIAAGALGAREHVQRIGRILRPAEGKKALAYELTTIDTVDEARARARRRPRAAGAPFIAHPA